LGLGSIGHSVLLASVLPLARAADREGDPGAASESDSDDIPGQGNDDYVEERGAYDFNMGAGV
jgi:hypothetical protein